MQKIGIFLAVCLWCGVAAAGEAGGVPALSSSELGRGASGVVQDGAGPFVVDAGDGGLGDGGERVGGGRTPPQIARTDEYYKNLYFPPERSVPLTKREQWILDQSETWQDSGFNSNPMFLPDGVVQYVYGTTHPNIVCAPLQLTDVELQPGEIVNSLNVGDPARWRFEAALTGSPDGDVQHVLIKPMDIGITTSMVIATNRRTYHLRLKSTQDDFFPRVSFAYPDDVLLKGQLAKAEVEKEKEENTLSQTGEYLGALTFKYKVTASRKAAGFKPVRVYNDGVKTILEMPETVKSGEMPVLLVVSRDGKGNPFMKSETTLVNYRVQSNRFIVDSIFDKAYLVKGVGFAQDRVIIERIIEPTRRGAGA